MDTTVGLCGKKAISATLLLFVMSVFVPNSWGATPASNSSGSFEAPKCTALLSREVMRLQDEKLQNLCQYAGKVVVVVNTASFCGFTSQYKGLEDLHKRYAARGLVVLGFPSNDFGAQEPGSNKDIAAFCENTFGVKFPMFTKTRVSASVSANAAGPISPLYADLKQRTGDSPKWNFHKYVIGRDGLTVFSFPSEIEPTSAVFIKRIEQLLELK